MSAFDAHRIGKHAYTFAEGTRREPPVYDGRRCLDTDELSSKRWTQDKHGRWRQPRPDVDASLRIRGSRRGADSTQGYSDATLALAGPENRSLLSRG